MHLQNGPDDDARHCTTGGSWDASQIPPKTLSIVDSHELLQGQDAILIEHNGEHYELRATKSGKLHLRK